MMKMTFHYLRKNFPCCKMHSLYYKMLQMLTVLLRNHVLKMKASFAVFATSLTARKIFSVLIASTDSASTVSPIT